MPKCLIDTCKEIVTKSGHVFCYNHWKAEQSGKVKKCRQCGHWTETTADICDICTDAAIDDADDAPSPTTPLSSTKLGQHFKLSANRINLILAELGWIQKGIKGWKLTDHGKSVGGTQREARQTGIPYVTWPPTITTNKVLITAIKESQAPEDAPTAPPIPPSPGIAIPGPTPPPTTPPTTTNTAPDFRTRFPATHRATDGHMVRSRAELLIDNALYMYQIVHAYERKLPIEEDAYCDFYLPKAKVYIEFWGMEKDPKYAARMAEKRALYEKYNFNLIQLSDPDITNLDDVLPRLLLKYNIECA